MDEERTVQWIGIDQFDKIYYLYTKFPRKELLELLKVTSCKNKYICDGKVVGFIVHGKWIKLYKTTEFHEAYKEKVK